MMRFGRLPQCAGAKPVFRRQLVWLAAVSLLVPGCGKPAPKGPQATVHGKVTVNGSPVPAGTVVSFVGHASSGGSARTEADGAYHLVGPTGGKTIPVDQYSVVVMPVVESTISSDEAMKLNPNELPKTTSVIPEKYQSPATTTEVREVKEGENEINIDLGASQNS